MKIEIMFRNLDKTKQDELLKAAGVSSSEEMNWHDIPIAIVEFDPELIEGEKHNEHP